MKIIRGNLWDSKDTAILVTANSYVNKRGRLVMGRGAALELKNRQPNIDFVFGTMISNNYYHLGKYGLLLFEDLQEKRVYGVFQVKYHYKDQADLELIDFSCKVLNYTLNYTPLIQGDVSMNFPGIGYGGRTVDEILPIISTLSDKVSIYIKD